MIKIPGAGIRWTIKKPNGDRYPLDVGMAVLSYDGLDMPGIQQLSQELPLIDGALDQGFSIMPRQWLLGMVINTTKSNYNYMRRYIMEAFDPGVDLDTMIIELAGPTTMCIDFRANGQILSANGREDGRSRVLHRTAVPLWSPDPFLYDPTDSVVEFFPLLQSTRQISYVATYPAKPVMRLTGPILKPVIRNLDTGQILSFTAGTGLQLGAGQWLDVDTKKGIVVSSSGVNGEAFLLPNSNVSSFYIAQRGVRTLAGYTSGTNSIQVTGEGMTAQTSIRVTYCRRYKGLYSNV